MNSQRSPTALAAASLCMLGACSSTPKAPATADAAGVECHAQKQTGSNFPVKVCTTRAQRDSQRDDAKEATDRMQRYPSAACSPQPCR
ncbi:MAG: hypothetical protein ABI624_16850 [Casimicrobiaceae bacterium]